MKCIQFLKLQLHNPISKNNQSLTKINNNKVFLANVFTLEIPLAKASLLKRNIQIWLSPRNDNFHQQHK